jgi:putative ABC transport system permease protein
MLKENLKLAWKALMSNKLRAMLTMLGIIIGIGSVITIVTIGDAITGNINKEWSGYGARNVTVQVTDRNAGSSYGIEAADQTWNEPREQDLITEQMLADYEKHFARQLEGVSVQQSIGSVTLRQKRNSAPVEVIGANRGTILSDKVRMIAGTFITPADIQNRQRVAVVSDRFIKQYFGSAQEPKDAIGKTLLLDLSSQAVQVYISGVYQYTEADGMTYTKDTSTKLYIPYTTGFQIQHKNVGFSLLTIVPKADTDPKQFLLDTSTWFESYYTHNEKISALTSSMAGMLKSMNTMLDQVKLGIGGVAAISLLVGGIGVMNIMMVSVTERTREIGIRMALGAKGRSIRLQFLTEAMMVSLCGGIIGIFLGLALGIGISAVLKYQAVPSVPAILVSVLFSMSIGIFFGYAPANRASKLDPIEALRYE